MAPGETPGWLSVTNSSMPDDPIKLVFNNPPISLIGKKFNIKFVLRDAPGEETNSQSYSSETKVQVKVEEKPITFAGYVVEEDKAVEESITIVAANFTRYGSIKLQFSS